MTLLEWMGLEVREFPPTVSAGPTNQDRVREEVLSSFGLVLDTVRKTHPMLTDEEWKAAATNAIGQIVREDL